MINDRRKTIFLRNGKVQLINIVVFSGIFSLLILLGYLYNVVDFVPIEIKTTNENVWREQARRELLNLKTQLILDIEDGTVNTNDELSLQKWASKRLAFVRNGGETSDAFMIELSSEKFIWDGSPDCSKEEFLLNGRYMKDEIVLQNSAKQYFRNNSITGLMNKEYITAQDLKKLEKTNPEIIKYFREKKYIIHTDYLAAEKAYNEMRQSYDTTTSSKKWWLFDDSREYLEWIIIPAPRTGFNNESNNIGGIKNKKYNAILIQLGTQEDEIQQQYKKVYSFTEGMKMILFIIGVVSILLGLLFMINVLFLQEECFNCPIRNKI